MGRDIDVWSGLTPEDLIEKMFERTDADGVLYMPSFFTGEPPEKEESLRCVMNWEFPNDCFSVLQEFDQLRSDLEQLADHCDRYGTLKEGEYDALSERQKAVWNTYLLPFSCDDAFDGDRLAEIQERMDSIEYTHQICGEIIAGKEQDEFSLQILNDGVNTKVSAAEEAYVSQYWEARKAECRKRLGDSPFAYYTVLYAKRYHRVLAMKAPDIILSNEAKALASALVLFRWCRKYEYVDNAVRQHYDRLEQMSEEELDELHRPRKNANSRKSMVSLFVYLILKQHSDSEHPLKQQEILSYLAEEPYEITVERKALSRVIQNLKSSQLGIYTDKHRGSWFMGGDN